DPVPIGSENNAIGRTATTYLDELGRPRRTEASLGADYGNKTLIVGAVQYDALGRVSFAADPYPSTDDGSKAYGTSYFFNPDGSPSCFVRAKGPQHQTPAIATTDEPSERYPTCYSQSFANFQQTFAVRDAASLLASSAQFGVSRTATLTG